MIYRVLCYKDLKLNVFTTPIYDKDLTDEDIIEQARRMCANPQMPKSYFDYDLYSLGKFDDKSGLFTASAPVFLVSLGDFRYLAEQVKEKKSHA